MMFEPPIHWHYAGKLRHALLDEASRAFVDELIRALKERGGPTILLSPVHIDHTLSEVITKSFKAAGMKVYALTDQVRWGHGLSTAYNESEASLRLATMTMDLLSEPAAARAAQDVDPSNVQKPWAIRRLLGHRRRSAGPSKLAQLRRQCRSADAEVILVDPPQRPWGDKDHIAHATKLMRSFGALSEEDPAVRVLPLPNLERDTLLELTATLPSQILDGSSQHERDLERGISDAAAESPEGFLVQALWRALKRGYGPDRMSSSEFAHRLAQLDPDIANAHPWSALFDLWREILSGLESNREHSGRWLNRIKALPAGPVSFEDIDDILLYEASIYSIYCEKDRNALSYLVVYHGSRWYLQRMALASMFGGWGGGATPSGGLRWDN